MPTLARTLVGRDACASNSTWYAWSFWIVISRWRTCASHGFLPWFVTKRQYSPFSTFAFPPPGAVKELVQGTLMDPSNVALATRFFGSLPAAEGTTPFDRSAAPD